MASRKRDHAREEAGRTTSSRITLRFTPAELDMLDRAIQRLPALYRRSRSKGVVLMAAWLLLGKLPDGP